MQTESFVPMTEWQDIFEVANIKAVPHPIELKNYIKPTTIAHQDQDERLTAAIQVLIKLLLQQDKTVEHVDRVLIDVFIGQIDEVLGQQLDDILHHEDFQSLESAWRGLYYVVSQIDDNTNIKLELLDIHQQDLLEDFCEVYDVRQSGLYHHLYTQEYDMPGGEPFAAMIANYEFSHTGEDLKLLHEIAAIAQLTHCPVIAAANAKFFAKNNFSAVSTITDLSSYLDKSDYIPWQEFRKTEKARYVGLTLPRFLLRLPYGDDNPISGFHYQESVYGESHAQYLWGNASFAFAVNLAASFREHGWTVNIRGVTSGGKVNNLPIYYYDTGRGKEMMMPTEMVIPESRELALANHGFIPLCYYKNSDHACFFSANSQQNPKQYLSDEATANSRINARLPYVFLVSRIAHYLKVLQRDNIGANKTPSEIEADLNQWLQSLVTKMNQPSQALLAKHPLREANVSVTSHPDNPGYYGISLHVMPHFQVEGIDVRLSLVSQFPSLSD